ncbi:MAG TPA: Uma2 family endonuclease [Gemmatimonadaceae bacterium]|nr:Uma2 family endonuclease [Gemmatimonadaceae bacterium]
MPAVRTEWAVEMLDELPDDGNLYELADGKRPTYPFDLTDLLLAVEVLSPSNSKYDYQAKRQLYLNGGVAEYWIIDAEAQTFARWPGTADPGALLTERIEWQPDGLDTPLVIELPEFFEDALG